MLKKEKERKEGERGKRRSQVRWRKEVKLDGEKWLNKK
jgi:hypothetical protein